MVEKKPKKQNKPTTNSNMIPCFIAELAGQSGSAVNPAFPTCARNPSLKHGRRWWRGRGCGTTGHRGGLAVPCRTSVPSEPISAPIVTFLSHSALAKTSFCQSPSVPIKGGCRCSLLGNAFIFKAVLLTHPGFGKPHL